jgi:hypothetical protein
MFPSYPAAIDFLERAPPLTGEVLRSKRKLKRKKIIEKRCQKLRFLDGSCSIIQASTLELCHGFSRSYYAEGQNISNGRKDQTRTQTGIGHCKKLQDPEKKSRGKKKISRKIIALHIHQIISRPPSNSTNRDIKGSKRRRRRSTKTRRSSHARTGKDWRRRQAGR